MPLIESVLEPLVRQAIESAFQQLLGPITVLDQLIVDPISGLHSVSTLSIVPNLNPITSAVTSKATAIAMTYIKDAAQVVTPSGLGQII